MNKHTPGPWEAVGNLVRTCRNEDGSGGFLIAECPANIGDRIENARLIAAAPNLLYASKAALARLREWSDFAPEIALLESAIHKAEGES
jgi:hypothetical protein